MHKKVFSFISLFVFSLSSCSYGQNNEKANILDEISNEQSEIIPDIKDDESSDELVEEKIDETDKTDENNCENQEKIDETDKIDENSCEIQEKIPDTYYEIATSINDLLAYDDFDTEQKAMKGIKDAGFKYLTFKISYLDFISQNWSENWSEYATYLKNICNELDLKFVQAQLTGCSYLHTDDIESQNFIEIAECVIRFSDVLGIKNVVINPDYDSSFEKDEWFEASKIFYSTLALYADEYGINVLCKNVVKKALKKGFSLSNAKEIKEFIEFVDKKNFHCCWDIGCGNCTPSQINDIKEIGEDIYAICCHDNLGIDDLHLMVGCGTSNFREIINALVVYGFRGYFALDCDDKNRQNYTFNGQIFNDNQEVINSQVSLFDFDRLEQEKFLYNSVYSLLRVYPDKTKGWLTDYDKFRWSEQEPFNLEFQNGKVECSNCDYVACLEKQKDKDFNILNLSDIQLFDDQLSEDSIAFKEFCKETDYLIKKEKPDLITTTGDQGYGTKDSIIAIGNFIDSYGIPWAPCFGNHDCECKKLDLHQQSLIYESFENCLFKIGPDNVGCDFRKQKLCGNYIINIVETDEECINVVRSIFVFNSGSNLHYQIDKEIERLNDFNFSHLSDEQVDFYKWGVESAKRYNSEVKSTIVCHIPLSIYNFAFAEAFVGEFSPYDYKALHDSAKKVSLEESYSGNCWTESFKDSFGVCHDFITSSPVDDKVFDRLLENNSIDSIIVGHDHKNNFCINYQDIYLIYSLKTGFGCDYEPGMTGGTIISFNSLNELKIYHSYVFFS